MYSTGSEVCNTACKNHHDLVLMPAVLHAFQPGLLLGNFSCEPKKTLQLFGGIQPGASSIGCYLSASEGAQQPQSRSTLESCTVLGRKISMWPVHRMSPRRHPRHSRQSFPAILNVALIPGQDSQIWGISA